MNISEYNTEQYECFSYIEETPNLNIVTNNSSIDFDDFSVQYYMYDSSKLSYLTNYIYPFWRSQFITKEMKDDVKDTFNPYATWSNSDLAKHNMGLRDNTMCFQLMVSDVPIGFCSLLLLDEFDRTDRMSPFSQEVYKDSLVFYNFVIEKGFRNEGWGSKLLDIIIEYIKVNLPKYKFITLYVDKDNDKAKRLYERRGFKMISDNPADPNQDLYKLDL
jgi:GNAT superfamily N-acetyltransferase